MLFATVRQRKIHVKNPVTVIQNGIGVDKLMLDMDEEWKGMTSIVCVFTNHYTVEEEKTETEKQEDGTNKEVTKTVAVEKEIAKEMLHTYGEPILVPWECLTQTGKLSVSCTGYVGEEKVMTTMLPDSFWSVVQNGPVTGEAVEEATPTLYEQILAAASDAKKAAQEANAVAEALQNARENGEFDGKDGAPGEKGEKGEKGEPGEPGKDGEPGRDGKDGAATKESIIEALGFTPIGGSGGAAGQFAISDGQGGITWVSLTNVGEVGA